MGFHRQCDGVTRRDAIKVGVLGSATGLTMSNFLKMADAGQVNSKATSKITMLPGGHALIWGWSPTMR